MNNKIFMPLKYNCYISKAQFKLYDAIFPRHTLIYIDKNERVLYLCSKMPYYNGKPENVILNLTWYDLDTHDLGITTLKGCTVTTNLYNAWLAASCPHAQKVVYDKNKISFSDYEKLMDHPRKKKSQTGGVRLSSKIDETITDTLKYNQNSVYAYCSEYLHAYKTVLKG